MVHVELRTRSELLRTASNSNFKDHQRLSALQGKSADVELKKTILLAISLLYQWGVHASEATMESL